ncbi:putative transcription factor interactor and regulator CCHC(Zn) family [Helianthus annuus]|nr:putative transcription factor interactor and regulator CCHC(Zn) family [Helianthus annuus]KAJ0459179.1 putative transcription factor interactor and regulator ARID family [Helianthus annuus]KAJ0639735.1 putative transcription factor interactor and regulator CCHC(Zn) family [Helianthus annuus]
MVCREPFTGTKTIPSHKIVHCLLIYLLCVNLNQMASHDSAANTYHNSAANMHDMQQSGIRASISISDNLRPTSSMMPCAHCSEERRDRRRMERRCYYCNMPGHQISSCQEKEKDEENQLLRQAVNAGIQEGFVKDNNHQVEARLEFILDGTDGGYWSDMWYVSKSLKRHFCNNIDMFKRIKNMSHVETKTGENHFFFIRGVGVVDVMSGSEMIRIQSVLYTTDIDRNILSYDQLITQGYTVKFIGDKCKLYPTFSVPINNKRNSHSGMTREEEMGELEKQSVINKGQEHEKFKTDFLNDYFEKLNISASSEPDWNILILQAMKFNNFNDCKALLDMLDDVEYFLKYKHYLEITFEKMIEWFLKVKLEIQSRPLPAVISNNRRVCLLDLYMAVNREGGHRHVTESGTWAMIAKDTGFEFEDGEYMRMIYAMYLDVLVYYYKFKITQEMANRKEDEKTEDPRECRSDGDNEVIKNKVLTEAVECSSSEGAAEKEVCHYALYAGQTDGVGWLQGNSKMIQYVTADHYVFYGGSDWHGLKKLQRKRFDFSRAKKAVNEANISVLKNSHKPNYV